MAADPFPSLASHRNEVRDGLFPSFPGEMSLAYAGACPEQSPACAPPLSDFSSPPSFASPLHVCIPYLPVHETAGAPHTFCCRLLPPVSPHAEGSRVSPFLRKQVRLLSPPSSSLLPPNLSPPLSASLAVATERDLDGVDAALLPPPHPASFLADAFAVSPPQDERERHAGAVPVCCNPGEVSGHIRKLRTASAPQTSENENNGCLRGRLEPRPLMGCASCGSYAGVASTNEGRRERGDARTRRLSLMSTEDTQTTSGSEALSDAHDHCTRLRDAPMLQKRERSAEAGDLCCRSSSWPRILYSPDELSATSSRATSSSDFHPRAPEPCGDGRVPPLASGGGASEPATLADLLTRTSEQERAGRHFGAGVLHYSAFSSTTPGACRDTREGADAFLSPPFSVFSLPESARERPGCGVNLVASPALPLSAEPAGAPGPAPQLCFCPLLEPQELAAGADPPQASTAHEGRRQDTAQSSFGSQATGELATGCRLTPSMPSPGQAMDPCQSAPRDLSQPTDALLAPFPPGASPERLPSQGPCHGVSRITQDSSPPPLPRAHSSGAVSSPVSLQTAPVPTGLSRTPSLPQSAAVGHVCFKAAEGAVTFSKSQCEKPCETQSGSAWSANYAADGEPCEPVSSFWITCGQHGPPARHAALQPSVTASARGPSQTPLSAVSDGGVSQGVEGPSHEGDSMRGNAPELILLAAGAEQLRKHATRESLTPSSSLMRDGVHAQSTSSSAAEGTAAALCVFRCLPPAQQPAAVPAFHVGVRLTGAVGACSADGMVVGNSAHLVSKVGLRGPQCGSGVPAFFHTVPNQHTYSLSMPHEPLAVNSSMSINPLASPLHAGSQLPEDQKRRVPLGAAFPSPHALTNATPGPPTAGENQGVRFLSEAAPLGTAGWVCFEAPVCRTLGATPSLAGRRATSLSAPPPPAALAAEGAQGEKSWVAAGSDSAHNKNPETVPRAGDQPDTANQQSPVRGSAESPPLASGAAQSVPPSQHVPLSHGLLHQGPQPRVMGVEAPCSSRMGSLPSGQKPLVASPSPSLRAVNGHECRHLDIHASSNLSPDAPALPCLLGATPSTPGDPTSPSMSQRRGCPALRWNATRACPRGSPLLSGPKEDPVAGAPAVMESSSVSHASGKGVSLSPPPSAPDVGAPRSQGHCAGSSTSTFGAAAPTGEDPSSATEALQRAQTDRAFSVLSSHASCSRRLYTPAGRAQGADQPSAVQEFEGLREKDGGELPPEGRAANGGLRTEGEDCGNRSPAGMAREGAALVALRCDGAHVIHATETPHTSTQTGNANEDPSWTGRGSTEGGSMSSTSNAGTPRDCGVLKEAAACEPRGTADARSIELESAFAPPGYRETGPDSADAVAGNPISASPGNSHVPIPAPEVLADAASRRGPSVNTSNGGRGGSFGLPFQRNCTSAGGTELPDEGSRLPSAATSGPAKTLGCGRNASPSDPSHFEERGLPATSQSFEQSPGYGFAAPLSYPPCSPRPSCLAPHGSRRLGVSTQTGASGAAAQAALSLWPSSSPPPQGGSPSDEATCGASAHREKAGADCVRQASRIGRVRHAALGTTMSPPVPNLHENVSDPARGEGTENGRIRPHSPQEIFAESPSRKRRPSCRREHEREGPPTGKRRASKRELIPDEDVSSSTPQFAGERRGSLASSPTGATETLGGHLFPFEKSDTERANSTKSVGLGMQEESAGHAGAAQASCRQPPLQPLCIPPKEAAAGVRDASSDATPGGRFAFDGNKGHGAADVFRHSEKPRSDQQSNSFGESNGKAGHARRTSRSRPSTHSDAARGRVRRGAAQEIFRHSEGAPEPMTGSPLSVSDPGAWKAAERDAALPLLVYVTVPAPAEAHPHAIRSAQDMHAVGCGDRGTTRAAGSRVAGAESTKQESAAASPPRAAAGSLGVRSVGRYGTPQSAALLEKTQPDNGEDETPSTVLPSGAEQEPKDEAAPSRFMASGGSPSAQAAHAGPAGCQGTPGAPDPPESAGSGFLCKGEEAPLSRCSTASRSGSLPGVPAAGMKGWEGAETDLAQDGDSRRSGEASLTAANDDRCSVVKHDSGADSEGARTLLTAGTRPCFSYSTTNSLERPTAAGALGSEASGYDPALLPPCGSDGGEISEQHLESCGFDTTGLMRQRLLQPQNENRRLESIFGYSSSSQNFKGFASQRARGERPFFSQAECVPVGPGPLSPFTSRETREDMLRKTDHNWVLKAKGKDPTNLPSLESIETTVGCSGADDFAAAGAHQAGGTTTAGPLSGEMCSVHPESGVSPSAAMLSKSHRLPATHRAGSNISFVVAEQQVSPSPRPRGHSNAMPYTWTAGAPCQLVFQKPAQDRACELVPGEGIGTPERRNGALDGERLSGEHMGGGRAQKEGRWEALSASLAAGTQAATAVPRDASAMGLPERHLAVASEQSTGPWLHENETSSSPPPVYPSAGVWQKPCEPGAVSFPPHVCADGAYTPSPVRISAPLGGMYVTSAGDRGALPARENVVPPGQPHGEAETARCAAAEKHQEKLPHEGGIQKERGNLYRSFSPPLPRILVEGASAASSHAEPASNSAQGPAPCFFQPERASETVGQGTPTAAGDSPESFHMPEDHPDASDPGAPRPLTEERESMVDLSDARWRDLKRQGYFRLGDKGRTSIKSRIARELRANPELRAQAAAVSGVRSATTKQLYQLAELCGFYDVLPPQFQPTSRPQSSSTLGSPVSPPESRERQLQQAALPPAADVPPPPASSHVQEEAVASCLPQGAMLHSVKHERAQGGAELPVKQAAGQTRAQGAASLWQAYGAPPAQMPHAYYAGEGRQGLEQTSCEGGRSELSPCDATAMQEGSCFPPEVPPTGVTSSFPAQGGEGQQYRGGPSPGESASVGLQNKRSKEASRERASASSNYSASLPISGLGQDGAGPNGVECAAFEVEGGCLQQEAGKQTQGRPTLLWPAQCHSLYAAVSMPGNGVAGSASALALASAGNEETPRSLESALSARTGTVCLSPSSETSLCSTTCASSCLSRTTSRSSSCRRAAHAR